MTILIGGVLVNQRGVWEGRNPVWALFFSALCSVISHSLLHLALVQNAHTTVFTIPASADQTTRDQWINFIYDSNVPVTLPAALHVCGKYFTTDSLANLGQY